MISYLNKLLNEKSVKTITPSTMSCTGLKNTSFKPSTYTGSFEFNDRFAGTSYAPLGDPRDSGADLSVAPSAGTSKIGYRTGLPAFGGTSAAGAGATGSSAMGSSSYYSSPYY